MANVGAVPTSIPEMVSQAGSSIDVPQQKEQSNAKSKLNEIMMGRLKRPVKKGDIEYRARTDRLLEWCPMDILGPECPHGNVPICPRCPEGPQVQTPICHVLPT